MMARAVVLVLLVAMSSAAYADPVEDGAEVFKRCRACHQVGENAKNVLGPQLNGLLGRKAGSVEGFNYSDANKNSGLVWDEKALADYIKDPRGAMPGNKMAFPGIKDERDVADLIAYLKTFGENGKQPK
ncbi:MAG: cytochrome c family protein [Hyphomonadaceae bacterium]|nr:cytochrome c family protein [Hyphomonadaceae bacterium]